MSPTMGPTVALKTPHYHQHQMVATSPLHKGTSWKANFRKFSTNFWKPRRKRKSPLRIWSASSRSSKWGNSWASKTAQRTSSLECQPRVGVSRPSGLPCHPTTSPLQTSTLRLGVPWRNCSRISIKITTLRSSRASTFKNGSSPTG